jgi:hypothetical protein
MLLIIALLLYLLIVLAVFIIAYRSGIRKWSALVLALIVAFIFLTLFFAPQKVLSEFDGSFLPLLYLFILLVTPLIIIIYCVIKILNDNCSIVHDHDNGMMSREEILAISDKNFI